MKIISWNVNGIRAAQRYGFLDWFNQEAADIVCLQELKAQKDKMPEELIKLKGYNSYFNFAQRKGYSGVAVYLNKKAKIKSKKLGIERFDEEGRIIKLEIKNLKLINLYLPHGNRDKRDLGYKLEVYSRLVNQLKKIKDQNVVLIGDFNIAHKEIDLARPKENQNNIMFTPEERGQVGRIIDLGFIDTLREFNKKGGNYTWWPYFANARERNLGWRIDYIFVSKSLKNRLKKAFILSSVRGSDHCPIGIEL